MSQIRLQTPIAPFAPVPRGGKADQTRVQPLVYRVQADPTRIDRQGLGAETRVRVPLAGPVDVNWRCAYRLVQLDSTGYFRYRLDLESPVVSFSVRGGEGAMSASLTQLQAFLDLVNAKASGG
jgi:hypothetical protein